MPERNAAHHTAQQEIFCLMITIFFIVGGMLFSYYFPPTYFTLSDGNVVKIYNEETCYLNESSKLLTKEECRVLHKQMVSTSKKQ